MTDSPFQSKRGLIKIKPQTHRYPSSVNRSNADMHDLSISLGANELQRMLEQQNTSSWLSSMRDESFAAAGDTCNVSERSIQYAGGSEQHWQTEKANMLFPQFLEVLQGRTNDSEVFDTIQDLIQTCAGVLEEMRKDERRGNLPQVSFWLEEEINTWKLLHALYKDRIMLQTDVSMDSDMALLNCSEKEVIGQLYACNSTLREYQLIVDWLEACYVKKDNVQAGHTRDHIMGWENTLFQLQHPRKIAFGSGAEIVKSLDPDAPIREKRPLHPLDEEDNARLSKCLFVEIRQGKIDEAMALCKHCGQTWRAAILEGWRLYEDPNYEATNTREKLPIDGNPRRDIWKKCAWLMADSKKFDEYTRAIAGAFCGHLESLKALSNNSWEDLLWSYLKVQIDIRVESEIRACCMKSYHTMPEAYWNGKMSLEQIFDELAVHKDSAVRDFANSKVGSLQKYLILDNIPELLQHMRNWVEADRSGGDVSSMTSHMLRFFTHIVLFMRQIGKVDKEEASDRVIAAYVERLIEQGDAELVAFYTAALPGKMQVKLYAQFLEGINETAARSKALEESMQAGLDVENITRHAVETIRNRLPNEEEAAASDLQLKAGDINAFDMRKIRALEWLTFYPNQSSELLWQTNALIRTFMGENKSECVRAAYDMVPAHTLANIFNIYGSKENLPCREECSIKEYLSYKVYLTAIDTFNDWSRLYHNQPKEPQLVNADANFTERIASEHKEQTYRAELKRWTLNLEEQAAVTRDALYNVLLFPEKGWLIDPDSPKDPPIDISELNWDNRLIQLEKLRSICMPEVVLLLHKVLHLSGDYKGCIKLADEIASETRQLYTVYTKHKLAELLSKFSQSSLALLNEKQDPFGFTSTV